MDAQTVTATIPYLVPGVARPVYIASEAGADAAINVRAEFDRELLALLTSWQYIVISVCLDKKKHRETYARWCFDPYHYCLAISEQGCLVSEQQHPDPDITLFMDSETFIDIIGGTLGGTSAYMSGRLRAEGNVMLATKLSSLFKR